MQNHAKSTETWDHSTSGEQHIPVHALQLEKGPTESHQGLRQQRQNLWDLVPLVPLDIFNPSPWVDWNCQKIHQIGCIKNPRLPSGVFALDIQTALFCLQPAVFVRDPANGRFGQWCWDQRPCCKFIWTNYKLEVTDGTAKKIMSIRPWLLHRNALGNPSGLEEPGRNASFEYQEGCA